MSERSGQRAAGIEGPAKWAAVVVLGGAGLVGIGRSFVVDTVHAPPARQVIEPVRVDPLPRPAPMTTGANSPAEQPDTAAATDPEPAPTSDDVSVRINVNQASAAELDLLPGIGPVYAERIVAERQANGAFTSVNDLERVRGIGPKTAAKLGPLVSFDRP